MHSLLSFDIFSNALYLYIFIAIFLVCTASIRQVQQFEQAVIFRFGKLKKSVAIKPGLVFVIPCIDQLYLLDCRTKTFYVQGQKILTKDSVTIQVDAIVYFHVRNAIEAICNVANYQKSTQQLALATIRTVLGSWTYAEVLSNREAVAADIMHHLYEPVKPWGVEVERVDIKDERLPIEFQRAITAEAKASWEAKAKINAATDEEKASDALTKAANSIAKPPGLRISTQVHFGNETVQTVPITFCGRIGIKYQFKYGDENVRTLNMKMKQFSVEIQSLLTSSNFDELYHRKSGQIILSVVQWRYSTVEIKSDQYCYTNGINLEVSLPTGTICAERAAITRAHTDYPNNIVRYISAVAVLQLSTDMNGDRVGDNPKLPCGVCQEWIKKLSCPKNFRVIAYTDRDLSEFIDFYNPRLTP